MWRADAIFKPGNALELTVMQIPAGTQAGTYTLEIVSREDT